MTEDIARSIADKVSMEIFKSVQNVASISTGASVLLFQLEAIIERFMLHQVSDGISGLFVKQD